MLYRVIDAVSSNIGNVLSINPSAYAFFFGDCSIHHKNLFGSILVDLVEPVNFLEISNHLIHIFNFLTCIHDCDALSLALLELFQASDPTFILQ